MFHRGIIILVNILGKTLNIRGHSHIKPALLKGTYPANRTLRDFFPETPESSVDLVLIELQAPADEGNRFTVAAAVHMSFQRIHSGFDLVPGGSHRL
jgi:hypothetical protein